MVWIDFGESLSQREQIGGDNLRELSSHLLRPKRHHTLPTEQPVRRIVEPVQV